MNLFYNEEDDEIKILNIIIAIIVSILTLILLFGSFCIIPTGYTGVRTTFGQISNEVVNNGFNWKIPLIQSIKKVNNKQQDIVFENTIEAETSERNEVYFNNVTITYQINPDKSSWIYANVSDYKSNLINENLVASALKSVSKTLTPTDVTARNKIEPLVKETLQESLDEKFGKDVVFINKVVISNATFDEAYNQKLAQKQQAQMAYETQQIENKTSVEKAEADAKAQLAKAQADADSSIIAAQADAEVAKISADSAEYQGQKDAAIMSNLGEMLNQYPNLIDYYKVTNWNGELPKVSSGSSANILNIDGIGD